MSANRVYMLYDYDEHGADHYVMTLDPARLPALYEDLFSWYCDKYPVESVQQINKIGDLLAKNKAGSFGIGEGWGGPVLVIAELDFAYSQKWDDEQREAYRKSIGWYDRPENKNVG